MKKSQGFIVVLALIFMPLLLSLSEAADKGDKISLDCPRLEKKDAQAIVGKVIPDGTVTDVKESPIKGVWQIDIEKEGQHGAIFLDCSRKYLMGQIIPVEAVGRQAPPQKVDVSKIPLDSAILLGAKEAPKKIIVFSDPDCPYCRKLHEIIRQILTKRTDIAFAVILNPLPMHKDAYKKAQAIQCTKSPEMLDEAFSGKAVPEPTCSADQIERNKALAKSLDFNGTPMLVREDGAVLSGYLPEDKLLDWIDKK